MDTKCFQYVLEICECGSINKAANQFGIAQSNLSVCIKTLNRNWGLPFSSDTAVEFS